MEKIEVEHICDCGSKWIVVCPHCLWIKVEDELPKNAGFYLVVANWMGVIEKAEFDGKSQWSINHLFIPTHWMPLPEAPSS